MRNTITAVVLVALVIHGITTVVQVMTSIRGQRHDYHHPTNRTLLQVSLL